MPRSLLATALLLLTLGAALRFWDLAHHSLWTDEFFTLQRISGADAPTEATPPLYFLLLKGWAAVAGLTPAALRAFSALCGAIGLVVVWAAGTRLLSPAAGLFALAVTAISPFHLAYSQEARPYAMLFALSAASLWTLAEALGGSRRWWLAYVPCTAALLYTHYWGLFVWAAGVVYAVSRSRSLHSWLNTALALPPMFFVPHLGALVEIAGDHAQPAFWTPRPALAGLVEALVAFTGARFYVGGWLFTLGTVAVAVALALWAAMWTTGLLAEGAARRWLICALGIGLLLPFAVSFALPQMFIAWRYTIAALPAAIWLAARGWSLWPATGRAITAAALLILMAVGNVHYFNGYEKGNIRQAAELIARLPAAETVLIVPGYLRPQWDVYYRGPLPVIPEGGVDEMAPGLAGFRHAIFITLDVPNAVRDALDARYGRNVRRRYPADFHLGLSVTVYRLR